MLTSLDNNSFTTQIIEDSEESKTPKQEKPQQPKTVHISKVPNKPTVTVMQAESDEEEDDLE